jgi:hypothetical protein
MLHLQEIQREKKARDIALLWDWKRTSRRMPS